MERKSAVLLVDDNEKINLANEQALRMKGYEVAIAKNLSEARERLSQNDFDVILLDVMLPDGDGFEFSAEIRDSVGAYTIFVTAKNTVEEKIRGLNNGGDAYLTKPFHIEEMLAMVDAAIRRIKTEKRPSGRMLKKGSLKLDTVLLKAYINEEDILLTPKEFLMLRIFCQGEGKIVSTPTLYEKVWGQQLFDDKNAVQVAVARLRKKIENSEYTINVSYTKGYIFERI
jgi:DNA-binding response OmpR family regulator